VGSLEYYTHQLLSLHHLHESWCSFIYQRAYKDKGTVLTLGTLKNYPIFAEFQKVGRSVLRLYIENADVSGGWATLTRPTISSGWHQHLSHRWILVYYPRDNTGLGDFAFAKHTGGKGKTATYEEIDRVIPVEGLCIIFRGNQFHRLHENKTKDQMRYSLVLTSKEK
jgi:hypothetical protein